MLIKEDAIRIERVKYGKKPTNAVFYIFQCSECKNEIKSTVSYMRKHTGMCVKCAQFNVPYMPIYNELKKSCNNKNRNFDLTFDDFLELISTPKCTYCNKELIFNKHTKDKDSNPVSRAYQLDRMNSDLGYIKSNLVTCCWRCNEIKSNKFSYAEFMLIGKVLVEIDELRKGGTCGS